jgi:hypothetical protein
MSPTTRTPSSSRRNHAVTAAIATTTIRNSGSSAQPRRRLTTRSSSTSAIEPAPTASVGQWTGPPAPSDDAKRTRKWSWTPPTACWPRRFFTWSRTSSTLAPAVKPTITEWEM